MQQAFFRDKYLKLTLIQVGKNLNVEKVEHLVRADAELEFVVAARLHDDGVASVQLRLVQVVAEFLVLFKSERHSYSKSRG